MRDNFSEATKRTLAARVAYRCSNPDCGAATVGPATVPDRSVNLGTAAHITAAAPGGPRYDPNLTAEERVSIANGIWACRKCGTLIDSDEPGYSAELLRRWKKEAEAVARHTLTAGLEHVSQTLKLAIPSLDNADSLLSFANTTVASIGRHAEIAELVAFLEDDERPFSWWLWTGPAGVGKSRLAVDLCRAMTGEWRAGFLREADQERLGRLRTFTPTLIVVDYAAQRSGWLSDALFELTQHDPGAPVRVLVLERDASGPWWDVVQRHHRSEEAAQVAAARYGLPRPLSGLSPDDLRTLIQRVAVELEASVTTTDVEDIADHAHDIDPLGRPLFAFVATIDWLSDRGISAGRDEALRRLVARANKQVAKRIIDQSAVPRALNARFLGSTMGGVPIESYGELLRSIQAPDGLLPGVFDVIPDIDLEEVLDGLRPDILGELFVLDRLSGQGTERLAANTLLRAAWQVAPDEFKAFVARTIADHREHRSLGDLLDVDVNPPTTWSWLAAGTIPLLRRSDHPIIAQIFKKLGELEGLPGVGEATVTARFHFANLVLGEGDTARANELLTEALSASQEAWPVRASILNNRGITWLELNRNDLAVTDFSAVIEAGSATDEARACALNNRADVYEDGNLAGAIADRTAVLALGETTYDRRYIGLVRRARALITLGDHSGAYRDLEAILEMPDIAIEQKMEARLYRAELRIGQGQVSEALADLKTIVQSRRNFAGVEERAHALLEER